MEAPGVVFLQVGHAENLRLRIRCRRDTRQHHHRAKDRRLSAMMVMSNIEKFSRNLEEISGYMAHNDSTATWLLEKNTDELEMLPEEELDNLVSKATNLRFRSIRNEVALTTQHTELKLRWQRSIQNNVALTTQHSERPPSYVNSQA